MSTEFRLLKPDEIEVRVGQVFNHKASLLLYKDARCDMAILDEVYDGRWQRDHKEVKGNMYAGVAVYDKELGQWLWRWDCGTESNTEKEKGEASDAFKRACVNLGIGRELYSAPLIMVEAETVPDGQRYKLQNKFQFSGCYVSSIDYDKSRKIKALEIVDRKGNSIFKFGTKTKKSGSEKTRPAESSKAPESETTSANGLIKPTDAATIKELAEKKGSKLLNICNAYKVRAIEEMTAEQAADCITVLNRKPDKGGN